MCEQKLMHYREWGRGGCCEEYDATRDTQIPEFEMYIPPNTLCVYVCACMLCVGVCVCLVIVRPSIFRYLDEDEEWSVGFLICGWIIAPLMRFAGIVHTASQEFLYRLKCTQEAGVYCLCPYQCFTSCSVGVKHFISRQRFRLTSSRHSKRLAVFITFPLALGYCCLSSISHLDQFQELSLSLCLSL